MDFQKVVLPELGEGIEEAKLLKIRKKIGDVVYKNEVVAEVATDKIDSEIESQADGIVTHINCQEGQMIKVGQTILALQLANAEKQTNEIKSNIQRENNVNNKSAFNQPNSQKPHQQINVIPPSLPNNLEQGGFLSPLVSSMITQHSISQQELNNIQGTGANGRVRKLDIMKFLENREKLEPVTEAQEAISTKNPVEPNPNPKVPIIPTEPAIKAQFELAKENNSSQISLQTLPQTPVIPNQNLVEHNLELTEVNKLNNKAQNQGLSFYENSYAAIDKESYDEYFQTKPKDSVEIVAMSRMRSVIAEHMRMSLDTSAHATLFGEADVSSMVKWRENEKDKFLQKYAEKLTYTHIVNWIVAQILPQFPLLNSSIDNKNIILKKNINLGMATALPTGDLIVPVIKNANQLSFSTLVKECNSLIEKARNNRLKFADIEGGTFTVSSIGSLGLLHGTPIIQQPQVAILVAGAIKSKPAIHKYEGQTIIVARDIMHLSFGFDHRIIDGMLAGNFLKACSEKMENFIPPELD